MSTIKCLTVINAGAGLAVIVAVFCLAQRPAHSQDAYMSVPTVIANRLVLVDDDGNERMRLAVVDGLPVISLAGSDGGEVKIEVDAHGVCSLKLSGEESRLELSEGDSGHSARLAAGKGTSVLSLGASSAGCGRVMLTTDGGLAQCLLNGAGGGQVNIWTPLDAALSGISVSDGACRYSFPPAD
jgi:hypothetical protein